MFIDYDRTHPFYIPTIAKSGDAGHDLKAKIRPGVKYKLNGQDCTFEKDFVMIYAGERLLIPTGVYLDMPQGHFTEFAMSSGYGLYMPRYVFEAQLRPRSGLANKAGITLLNTPATIDSGYKAEIHALIYNASDNWFRLNNGDRVCQMVFSKAYIQKEAVLGGVRGENGFGSTGV